MKKAYIALVLFVVSIFLSGCAQNPYVKLQRRYAKQYDESTGLYQTSFADALKTVAEEEHSALDYASNTNKGKWHSFIRMLDKGNVDTLHDHFYAANGIELPNGEHAIKYTIFTQGHDVKEGIYPAFATYYFPVLYSAKGLCYADFSEISTGSLLYDVAQVDPTAQIELVGLEELFEEYGYEQYDGSFYETCHLLDEGILYIRYILSKTEVRVSYMRLYRDYVIEHFIPYNGSTSVPFYVDPADRPPRVDPPPTGEAPPDIVGELSVK